MQTSNLFSLNFKEVLTGLFYSVGGAAIAVVEKSVEAGSLTFNVHAIETASLAAGIMYLSHKFFTPAQSITPVK